MRFLLDECLSQRLVSVLVKACHDVIHVVDTGLTGRGDDDAMDAARTEGRVRVSADTDFGEHLARGESALPSLILLRQGNRAPEHQTQTLLENFDQVVDDDLNAGAIVVFTNDSIRIRRLPIHG